MFEFYLTEKILGRIKKSKKSMGKLTVNTSSNEVTHPQICNLDKATGNCRSTKNVERGIGRKTPKRLAIPIGYLTPQRNLVPAVYRRCFFRADFCIPRHHRSPVTGNRQSWHQSCHQSWQSVQNAIAHIKINSHNEHVIRRGNETNCCVCTSRVSK